MTFLIAPRASTPPKAGIVAPPGISKGTAVTDDPALKLSWSEGGLLSPETSLKYWNEFPPVTRLTIVPGEFVSGDEKTNLIPL